MRQIILLLLLLPGLASAEIYRWKDSGGQIHFSETPVNIKEAEKNSVEPGRYGQVVAKNALKNSSPRGARVVMYATSWCPYCAKARKYFKKNNISYVEYDIEKDKKAKKKYDSIGGSGVPLILVGDKRLNGFSESGFEKMLDKTGGKQSTRTRSPRRDSVQGVKEIHGLE